MKPERPSVRAQSGDVHPPGGPIAVDVERKLHEVLGIRRQPAVGGIVRIGTLPGFVAVRRAVAVGVGIVRICSVAVFLLVGEAVGVRIEGAVLRIEGVETVRVLPAVRHPVPVSVEGARICAAGNFLAILDPVGIRVGTERVGSRSDPEPHHGPGNGDGVPS